MKNLIRYCTKVISEAKLLLFFALMILLSNQFAIAQTINGCTVPVANAKDDLWSPECYFGTGCTLGSVCTANDVTVTRVYVANAVGEPIDPFCPYPGSENLYLWATFNASTTRYAVRTYFEIWENGVYLESRIVETANTLAAGTTFVNLTPNSPVALNCTKIYTIRNVWIGWETASNATLANTATCGKYQSSKCSKSLTPNYFSIVIPSINYECGNYDVNSVTLTFNASATGGDGPYTYSWIFSDETTYGNLSTVNHTFNTSLTGAFTVKLRATDSYGAYGETEVDLDLPRISNCPSTAIFKCSDDPEFFLKDEPGLTATPEGGYGDYFFVNGGEPVTSFNPVQKGQGTYHFKYIYTDKNGCSAICFFDIVVYPQPTLQCPVEPQVCPSSTLLELKGIYGVTATPAGGTGVYSGTGVTKSGDSYFLDISNIGIYNITYNYTKDGCSNSCNYTIKVTDMGITCPNPVQLFGCSTDVIQSSGLLPYTESKTELTYAEFTSAGAGSICGDQGYSYYYQDSKEGTCPIIVTRRFFIEVPNGGASVSCDQVIKIYDKTPPVFKAQCTSDIKVCKGETVPSIELPTATDNCDTEVTVTWLRSDGEIENLNAPFPVGETTITFTAKDECENTASCEMTVNIYANPTCLISVSGEYTIGTGDDDMGVIYIDPLKIVDFCVLDGMASYAWTGPFSFSSNDKCITVNDPGNYSVTIADANGCKSTCELTLGYIQTQGCELDGIESVCPGSTNDYSTTTTINQGFSYNWSLINNVDGATISGATNGNSVIITAGNECKGTYTVLLEIKNPGGRVVQECQMVVSVDGAAVAVTGPENYEEDACDLADQDAIDAAFAAWLAAFEVTEEGCGVTAPDLSGYSAPLYCAGGEVEVIYGVNDGCTNARITRTFKINAPAAVAVTGPENYEEDACDLADQDAIDAAFAAWLAAFEVTEEGCGVTAPDLSGYSAPLYCAGGEVEVIYGVNDGCTNARITRTFKIKKSPLRITCAPSVNLPECTPISDVESAYAEWVKGFSFVGGCGSTDNLIEIPGLPADFCEGVDLRFKYIATDKCGTVNCTSTFYVAPDVTTPIITCLADKTISCPGELKFDSPKVTDNCDPNPKLTFVDGDNVPLAYGRYSITRKWIATDNCGNTSTCSQTITVEPCCNTAYAFRAGSSTCFIDKGFSNWGWSIQINGIGTYTIPLYAGAAGCNINKGQHVGNIVVVVSKSSGKSLLVTVRYNIFEGYGMNEAHLYVGTDMFPVVKKVPTVSPGQYTIHSGSLNMASTWVGSVTVSKTPFYLIAHAVVCNVPYEGYKASNAKLMSLADNKNNILIDAKGVPEMEQTSDQLKVYPNPFTHRLYFDLQWHQTSHALLEIFDIRGAKLATLFDNTVEAGQFYRIEYAPGVVTPGMLMYRLVIDNEVINGKVLYQKQK